MSDMTLWEMLLNGRTQVIILGLVALAGVLGIFLFEAARAARQALAERRSTREFGYALVYNDELLGTMMGDGGKATEEPEDEVEG